MAKSSISYLDWLVSTQSFNCRKASPGCDQCYAERLMAKSGLVFDGMPTPAIPEVIANRFRGVPKGVVCGLDFMSDLGLASFEHWELVFSEVANRPDCQFIFTTKRPQRFEKWNRQIDWPKNLWVGVSIENADYAYRAEVLNMLYCAHRWWSIEPMIGDVGDLNMSYIEWVVTGGESGATPRYFDPMWALRVGEKAQAMDIPWYHKQGSCQRPDTNRELFGKIHDDKPAAFQMRSEQTGPTQLTLFGD
jgi:protein gp37